MDDTEKPRSIRFPQALWDRIDEEARRCKRSAVKQMEVVLSAYYAIDQNVELNAERLETIQKSPNLGTIASGVVEAKKQRIARLKLDEDGKMTPEAPVKKRRAG